MLDRLEGADRPAELVAYLRIGNRGGEHGLAEPEAVARDRDGGSVVQTTNLLFGVARESQHLCGLDTVCGHRGQTAGFVDHRLPRDGQSCDIDHRRSLGIGGDDQQPICAIGVRH